MRQLLLPLFCSLLALSALAQDAKPVDAKVLRKDAQAAVQAADWSKAIAGYEQLTKLEPKVGAHWHMLGYSLHAAKKYDEALVAHQKAAEFAEVRPVATYNIACVYALKGDKEQAFAYLNKAIDAGFAQPDQLVGDPDFDALREDPRWKDMQAKVEMAAANRAKAPAAPFVITTERKSSRVVWFDQAGNSPGQLSIDYAPVGWQDKFEALVDSPKMVGKHWRLGADVWTSLDTMLPVTLGGVKFEPGQYYLTLVSKGDGKFSLFVHDANDIRKLRLDAYQSQKLNSGREVALAHAKLEKVAEKLEIAITLDGKTPVGELAVRFGGHQLTTKVEIGL